jgi:hypothetical protein
MHQIMKKYTPNRWIALLFLLAFTITSTLAGLTPLMSERVFADSNTPTNAINLLKRGTKARLLDRNLPFGTCTPYFAYDETKDDAFLSRNFYPGNMADLPYDTDPKKLRDLYFEGLTNRGIASYIGGFHANNNSPTGPDNIVNVMQYKGEVRPPIIKFRGSAIGSNPMHGQFSGNGSICNEIVAIPISKEGDNNLIWRAYIWENPDGNEEETNTRRQSYKWQYLELSAPVAQGTTTHMQVSYYGVADGNSQLIYYQSDNAQRLIVEGAPVWNLNKPGGSVGAHTGEWVDAATIKVTGGTYSGDTYKKKSFSTRGYNGNFYSYYFLDTSTGERAQQTLSNNSNNCDTPLPPGNNCGGQKSCVPFIAVQQKLNVSEDDQNLRSLQDNADQLGGSATTLYNFDPDTCQMSSAGANLKLTNPGNRANVWFYYSATSKAMMSVFSTGDGNEQKYVGLYPQQEGQPNAFTLGCNATITGTPPPSVLTASVFKVQWALTDGKCDGPTPYGTVTVSAMGGAEGENGFAQGQQQLEEEGLDPADGEAKLICNLTKNPFTWVFCPITMLALEAIEAMEAIINDTLTLKTDRIFSDEFREIWTNFRTLALAMIVIAALIMVLSQALDLEWISPVTARKTMPQIFVAGVGITFCWPLMEFFVNLSNDGGTAIRYLIYAPFDDAVNIGAATGLLVTLLTSGALLVFGVLATMSFVLTALLGAATALAVITFRELFVMALVATAPFAIGSKAVPGLEKVFSMWWNGFTTALGVFIVISAFIATGRVFAIIALQSGGNETMDQITALIAIVLPYFLLTTAFKLVGGGIAVVSGAFNNQAKGAFDRLSNYRNETAQRRGKAFQEGRFYDSDSVLMKPGSNTFRGRFAEGVNRLGARSSVGMRGRFGFGDRGQTAMATAAKMHAMHNEKDPALTALAMQDDDALFALAMGNTEEQVRDAVTARWGNTAQAQRALAAARSVGINHTNQGVMMGKLTQNKARAIKPGDTQWIERAATNYADGNAQMFDKSMNDMQYNLRSNGRGDLGGTWHANSTKVAEWAQRFQASGDADVSGGNTVSFGYLDEHGNQTTGQFSERAVAAAKQQVATDNGVGRIGLQQYIAGHPASVNSLNVTAKRALEHGSTKDKEVAAMQLLEASKGLSAGMISGDSRDAVVTMLNNNGIPLGATEESTAQLLADKIGNDPLTGARYTPQMLTARARVYDMAAERANMQNPEQ